MSWSQVPILSRLFHIVFRPFIEADRYASLKRIRELEDENALLKNKNDQAEAYLNNLIRVVPASVYWKDCQSVILGSNLVHAKLAGFTCPEEVLGKTEHDFIWKDQAKSIIDNDQKIIASGKGLQLEESAILSDGMLHTFLTSKEPLRDKARKIIGIIGVSLDITEQKQSEIRANKAEASALLARAKATSEEEMRKTVMVLVGDIVHDLRTPIATIRTIGSLLSTIFPIINEIVDEAQVLGAKKIELLSKKQSNALRNDMIVNALQSSVIMMDNFISSTLLELKNAQQLELVGEDLVKCSSRRILENTLDAYPLDNGITIHQNIAYDFYLMGNSILIMKMLFNLIRNAIDQINLNGMGEIFISTEAAGDSNTIKVKDTAGGASSEAVTHFFDGYFTTKKEGTGIGLAFCKKTMQIFGGDIMCNNIYGENIEFILSFPRIKDEQ
ncbi:MAG: PAS domain-containing sensor histidine kinase [Legionellaceae bacterium]|nr:PAS domain-containing sensor histidine kinase [Legionellaceae bacterium]